MLDPKRYDVNIQHAVSLIRKKLLGLFDLFKPEAVCDKPLEINVAGSDHIGKPAHAVLILDQDGWHTTGKLVIPSNITLLPLPPRSPELNPVENIWQSRYRPSGYADHTARGDGRCAWRTNA